MHRSARRLVAFACLVVGAAWASSLAAAAPPVTAGPSSDSGPRMVGTIHRILPSQIPEWARVGHDPQGNVWTEVGVRPTDAQAPISAPSQRRLACGPYQCLYQCWSVNWDNYYASWNGSAHVYQYDYWCGDGLSITYASVGGSSSQNGMVYITSGWGPYYSGGCAGWGCSSLSAANGIYFQSCYFVNQTICSSDQRSINATMYAWGGASAY